MTLPTFVVIGAMKAGTVSLRHYLDEHPDVFLGRGGKFGEPNFLGTQSLEMVNFSVCLTADKALINRVFTVRHAGRFAVMIIHPSAFQAAPECRSTRPSNSKRHLNPAGKVD